MIWKTIINRDDVYCGWEATGDAHDKAVKFGQLFYWSGPLAKDGAPIVWAEPATRIFRTRLNIGSKIKNPYLTEDSLFPVLSDFVSAKRLAEYYDQDHGGWDEYTSEIERILQKYPRQSKYHVFLLLTHHRLVDEKVSDPWYLSAREVLGEMMLDACVGGWERLDLVTKAAKAIESKSDYLKQDIVQEFDLLPERKLLNILERVTLEIKEPPTQDVLFQAYCKDGEFYRRGFDRLVKKLGFQWLPTRGEQGDKSKVS